jgi:replication factor A1
MFNDPERANSRFPVPILQCLQIKTLESKAATAGAAERYRVVLSDTQNYVQSMLATQVNHVVHDGLLQRGSIVRLKQYQANSVKGKKFVFPLPTCPALLACTSSRFAFSSLAYGGQGCC